jgi:hypothetical protein
MQISEVAAVRSPPFSDDQEEGDLCSEVLTAYA